MHAYVQSVSQVIKLYTNTSSSRIFQPYFPAVMQRDASFVWNTCSCAGRRGSNSTSSTYASSADATTHPKTSLRG